MSTVINASGAGLAGTPINIGATLDIVMDRSLGDLDDSEFEVRAFELNIGAPVDPYFDFVSTIGWHEGEFELEEAWVSTVIGNMKYQFGRELVPFGYLNRVHEHDFPQVDQPFVIEGLTTDHGLIGDGGHVEYLAPFINPTLTVNLGIYENILHSIGRRIDGYPVVGRIQSFYQSPMGRHSVLAGLSRTSSIGDRDRMASRLSDDGAGNMITTDRRAVGKIENLTGFDVKYHWSPGGQTYRGLHVGGEYLHARYQPYLNHQLYLTDPDFQPGEDKGFYAYAQWNPDRFWGYGYRYDRSDVLFHRANNDASITAHSIYGEWRPTEFSRIRLQYQQVNDSRLDDLDHRVMLQGVFFIGWHPPHRF